MSAVRPGLTMVAVACLGSLATAGCARTSDGSIEFNKPSYEMPNWFKRRAAGPAPAETAVFPAPPPEPQPIVVARPRPVARKAPQRPRNAMKQPVVQPQITADPPAPVTCRNITQSGGRVKYVCE